MSQSHKTGDEDSLSAIGIDVAKRLASPLIMLAVMWLIRISDFVIPIRFNGAGLRSWDFSHWYGIFTMPFLHSSWPHLLANSLPFLVLGGLVVADGVGRFWAVTAIVMVVSAVGAFFLNEPGTVTVGASGLVFGYFGYLAVAAFFARTWSGRIARGIISLVVIGVYGSAMLFGILPRLGHISWQAHLFGLIGGVCAAWAILKWAESRNPQRPRAGSTGTPGGKTAGTGDPELDAILRNLD